MANAISDFYPGTTKTFTVTCKIGGVAQNITADTVTFRMKSNATDSDANAALTKTADVTTSGASGIAAFELTPTNTAIDEGNYTADIVWELSTGEEYVVYYDDRIKILVRVSDAS